MRTRSVSHSVPVRLLALVAGAGLLIAACGDDDSTGSDDTTGDTSASVAPVLAIDGAAYVSESVTGEELVEGSLLTIAFDGDQMSASAGCNSMAGPYSVVDGALVVGDMATTQMFCDGLMDQEQWYSKFLTTKPAISQDGSNLTLAGGDVTIVYVDREIADPDRPLEGTTWLVTGAISAEAVSSVPEGASIVMLGGSAAVDTGCNTGSVSYEVSADGSTITFGDLAMTKMACADPAINDLEAAVIAALSGTVDVEIDAASMTLQGETAGLQLTADE